MIPLLISIAAVVIWFFIGHRVAQKLVDINYESHIQTYRSLEYEKFGDRGMATAAGYLLWPVFAPWLLWRRFVKPIEPTALAEERKRREQAEEYRQKAEQERKNARMFDGHVAEMMNALADEYWARYEELRK